jgi:MFS family permease
LTSPPSPDSAPASLDRATIAGIATALVCALVSAIGFALNAPFFALNLDDRGIGADQVGLFMTVAGIAGLACTPLVPWLMGRLPVKAIMAGCICATAGLFLLYLTTQSVWAWTAIRFGFATTLTIIFVTSEAWLLELAPERWRGRLLGLYAAMFAGGFGIGGLIVAQLGHRGIATPITAACVCLCVLPVLLLKSRPATRPHGDAARPSALWARISLAPALFVPALAMGAIETGAFNLFPLWVRRIGFEDQTAGLLIAACALGNVILQGPIGALADRYGRNRAMIGVAIIGLLGPITLMAATSPWQAYGIGFVWSGCVTGFYTLGLMGLAERFQTSELAGANAGYAASYGLGQMIAPLAGGALLQYFGPAGFLAGLSVMALGPLLAVWVTRSPR